MIEWNCNEVNTLIGRHNKKIVYGIHSVEKWEQNELNSFVDIKLYKCIISPEGKLSVEFIQKITIFYFNSTLKERIEAVNELKRIAEKEIRKEKINMLL